MQLFVEKCQRPFSTVSAPRPTAGGVLPCLMVSNWGKIRIGAPPAPVAAAARAQGIIIYCIGLIGSDGLDTAALNQWATDPDATHVAITPDAADLEALFAQLAANISKPGATGIVIHETVSPDFIITGILAPNRGTVDQLDARSLRWSIDQLGVSGSESAVLELVVRHVGQTPGSRAVNQSITYSDQEGNLVVFPDPRVLVDCSPVVVPEPCPVPVELTAEACADFVTVDAGDVYLDSQGRIVQLDVTVKRVCPRRRTALAVILTRVDDSGRERSCGMKTMTLPAHNLPGCRDVLVRGIRFVVPAEPDTPLCRPARFNVRLIAHSMDADFRCVPAPDGP